MLQVADGVFCGTGTDVNWVIVREGSDLTLVDAGWRGDLVGLEASIREIGCRPEDVRAILLTHAHADHLGGVPAFQRRHGTSVAAPLLMHARELPNARGEVRETGKPTDVIIRAWRPRVLAWGLRMVRAGGLHHLRVADGAAFVEGGPLDLPGGPVPILCAGHTSGHCAYLFPRAGAIATGDALVTGHPLFGAPGPQVLRAPFSLSDAGAAGALDAFDGVDADVVVPGHGSPWREGLAAAVAHARELAARG